MPSLLHVDAATAKGHSFNREPRTLLASGFARQLDLTTRADDTVPRQLVRRVSPKQASDCSMVKRIASR